MDEREDNSYENEHQVEKTCREVRKTSSTLYWGLIAVGLTLATMTCALTYSVYDLRQNMRRNDRELKGKLEELSEDLTRVYGK